MAVALWPWSPRPKRYMPPAKLLDSRPRRTAAELIVVGLLDRTSTMNFQRKSSLLLLFAISLLIACRQEAPVALVQVEPASVSLAYPQTSTIHLTWLPRSPLQVSADRLVVFVHLLDQQGRVERTFDHPFPASWTVGEEVAYPLELFQSAVDPPVPAATYGLAIGLWEASGRRWPLQADGPEIDDEEYLVAQVEVPDAARSTPKFSFSGSWLQPEETGNRQPLANQWLGHKKGQLVIWGIDQPGAAVLSLVIPELPERSSNESLPAVHVSSRCAEVLGQVAGHGTHEVRVAISPAATGDSCTVSFDPNFFRVSKESEKRSALLERVSWTPKE